MLSPRRAPGKPWVRAAGAWGRGWRPEARGWGWMGWGGVGTGGRAAGLGALVCGAGETGLPSTARSPTESPKDLVPGRPPAPSSPTPARPGSPGRVRPGRKQARCCLAHRACPGRCSPRPVSSQPPQRGEESAPLGERPVLAREGVPRESRGAPSRRWPVAARGQGGRGALSSMTCWHGLLGENPPRALGEVRGLGWAPEAKGPPRAGCREWQGTAPTTHPHPDPHGHRAPPHPHWPSQAQAGALPWAPRSMGGHGGREARRAAYHTPRRRTLPMQAPGQGPGPGLGGGWKSVEAAGPTGWPSLPPSGMGRPVSTDACGAEPGRLVPCPSAPGFSARAAAGLWHSSLAPALAGVPGQRPEGDRPEPQARHRRRGKNRPALSPTPKAALDPAVAEPEPGGLLE